MSDNTILIAAKFRGPPNSGNGGYVAGRIADALTHGVHNLPHHGAVEVTLRAPIPLDHPLAMQRAHDSLTVHDGNTLIAEAAIKTLQMDVPTPADWDAAVAVRDQSYSFPVGINTLFTTPLRGVHPICFCCGAELAATEGAHVYAAPLKHNHQVAAAWIPDASLAQDGKVRPEMIWTALDCPGQMAWRAEGTQTGMLGRITARIEKPVRPGDRCVVIGWTMGNEGKKYFAGTALFNSANELCAYAKAVWIGRVGLPTTRDQA
jgi:hypothetical protein